MSNSHNLPWPGAAEQFLLRQDVTYLNHGSFGACPAPVFDTYQARQRELEAEPVDFLDRRLGSMLEEARRGLSAFIGADPDDIVFVPNATFGVNIVARSLPLEAGDEVLATNHEYGASDRTWRYNCALRGAHYKHVEVPLPLPTDEEIVERLWQGVTERTKVIFISHITSPTALQFPVAAVCKRAKEAGIMTVVDGAHAPGQLDLSMADIDADFYTGNCHKWLCAPKGAAFLYARRGLQAILSPLVVSWGWESERPSHSRFLDHFSWVGTTDPSAFLSVDAAIEFQRSYNWPLVRQACNALVLEARERLCALLGTEPISDQSNPIQMCAVELPVGSIEKLGTRLWDTYKIEIPLPRWNGREFIRVSIQAYNSRQDIERLEEALREILL